MYIRCICKNNKSIIYNNINKYLTFKIHFLNIFLEGLMIHFVISHMLRKKIIKYDAILMK